MYRIDTVDVVETMPAAPASSGVSGFYSDGDVATGSPGTPVSAHHLNTMQEEISGVVEYAGIALDKTNHAQLLAAIRSMVEDTRVGEVFWWPFDTVPGGRALRCFGQAVSRTGTTAKLFAKAGTKYGAGDGSTTFNLPDPRKYFMRVWDDRLGEAVGRTQADQNKSHNHGASSAAAGGHNHGGASAVSGAHNHGGSTTAAGAHNHTVPVPPAATNPDTQGAADGASNVDITQLVSTATSNAPDHTHGIPLDGDHAHAIPTQADHTHPITVNADGGDETRPINMAWPLYIRY